MKKCIIVTAFINGKIKDLIDTEDAYIICADGGYARAMAEDIIPDIVIGDFDSFLDTLPSGIPNIKAPTHKDLTDTAMCIDHAIEQGYTSIILVGGLGGRLDHTVANLQNMFSSAMKGVGIVAVDEQNIVMALVDDEMHLPAREGCKLSLFSYSEKCTGVTVTGVEYPLENMVLTSDFPLGVSNEFTDDEIYIRVENGQLLVILSKDL